MEGVTVVNISAKTYMPLPLALHSNSRCLPDSGSITEASLSDRDEFGVLAPDEERHERDASVMEPESGRQRELLSFAKVGEEFQLKQGLISTVSPLLIR